jgi:hypothetical protein
MVGSLRGRGKGAVFRAIQRSPGSLRRPPAWYPGDLVALAGLLDETGCHRTERRLLMDPEAGAVLPGSGGVRKMRVALPGRGKRGGARVIYYYRSERRRIYLLFAYGKSETATLSPRGIALMRSLVRKLRGES